MPEFRVIGIREISITQSGDAWVEAETLEEAKQIAEDDPDGLDWNWDDLDAEDGDSGSIEIRSIEDPDTVTEDEEEEVG